MKIDGKTVEIKRENAIVSETDEAYCELVSQILNEGIQTHNRTGIDTLTCSGMMFEHNMADGFPILTSRRRISTRLRRLLTGRRL